MARASMIRRLVALVVAAAALWWAWPRLPPGIHVSGDFAGPVAEALAVGLGPDRIMRNASAAGTRVVLVTDWGKLRHVPGTQALCGAPCQRAEDADFVQITQIAPRQRIRTYLLRLDPTLEARGARSVTARDPAIHCAALRLSRAIAPRQTRVTLGPACPPPDAPIGRVVPQFRY